MFVVKWTNLKHHFANELNLSKVSNILSLGFNTAKNLFCSIEEENNNNNKIVSKQIYQHFETF